MRRILFSLTILLLVSLSPVSAYAESNIGFIQGNIWFSIDPFFSGENVRIYTAILNNENEDIIGTIQFFDNGNLIGSTKFQSAKGTILEQIWIDWLASEGQHNIHAEISDLAISIPGKGLEKIEARSGKSGQVAVDIDIDTDGDRIGNKIDEDDDNDGLSDQKELELGTDPLNPDTDGDGLSDKEEFDLDENEGSDSKNGQNNFLSSEDKSETLQEKAIELTKKSANETKNFIDKFADYEKQGLSDQKARTERALELIRGTAEPKNDLEKEFIENNKDNKSKGVFLRSYLILLSLLEALFRFKIILYILLLLILWKVAHWLFLFLKRKWRGYDKDDY